MTKEQSIGRLGDYIKEYSVRNKDGEDIPVYSVTNSNGFCTEYFDKEVASKDQSNYKIVPRGYFAYNPSRINVGSIDYQKERDKVVVSPLYVVFGVDERIDKDYLLYYLKSEIGQTYIRELASGSVRANLKFSILQDFPIPMVPLETQKEYVKRIKKIDSILEICDEMKRVLEDTVQARFVEMFGDPVQNEKGWRTKALEDACRSIVDCPHSTPSYTSENTGFMCIRTSIVKKNRIIWEEIEYIPEDEYTQRIQRKRPEKGDVIYTREGAILGIAAVIDRDCNVALGQRSMLLSPDRAFCTPEFISVAMNFDSFLDHALKGMSGSASPHINVGDIKAFKMILPPIKQQEVFSAFVTRVGKSKLAIHLISERMQMIKVSLIQEYFS